MSFRSTSDTNVLFEHLIHFGVPETLQAVKGMFAFSFCDLKDQTVYLCRDRLGIKPLVWTYQNGALFWASEVKALAAAIKIDPDPIRTLFSAASIGDHSNEYTVFQNVEQVRPGHYLICRPGMLPESKEYYNVTWDVDKKYYQELDRMSLSSVQNIFETILQRSVQQMLMSDAPMGAFVSGGIDSSLIATIAAQSNPDLTLFTANVVGKHSEFEDAQILGRTIQKPLYDIKFLPEMILSGWVEATYYYECPIVTHTNAIPFAGVAKLAHQKGVKAVLTGEGADELFLGYPRLLTRRWDPILRAPINFLAAIYGLVPRLKEYVLGTKGPNINDFIGLLVQRFERQQLRGEGEKKYAAFLPSDQVSSHYLSIQMIREGLVALLHRNDRMGMLAGVESRFPFLDEEMIRFAVNLPLKWKTSFSLFNLHNLKHPFFIDKFIVRQAAASRLPKRLVMKKKNGFPMYGHKNIRVKLGYFENGYIAHLLRLSKKDEEYMLRTQSPYYVAKLVSVDIFGRLFAFSESISEIKNRVLNYIEINP